MDDNIYSYSDFATDGKCIWYITEVDCLLMQIDIITGKVECLGKIPETEEKHLAYRTLIYFEGKLFLVPYNANKICEYNVITHKYTMISFSRDIFSEAETERKLFGKLIYKSVLILYGIRPIVIKFDLKNYTFKAFHINASKLNMKFVPEQWFWRDGFIIEDNIVLPISHYNVFVIINLTNNDIKIKDIGDGFKYNICHIVRYYENKIFLICSDIYWLIHIFVIDIKTKKVTVVDYNLKIRPWASNTIDVIPFYWGDVIKDKIILLAGNQDKSFILDLKNKTFEILSEIPFVEQNITIGMKIRNYFCGIRTLENTIVLIHSKLENLISIDLNDKNNISIQNLTIDKKTIIYIKNLCYKTMNERKIIKENWQFFQIADFLYYMKKQKSKEKVDHEEISTGIWEKVKQEN